MTVGILKLRLSIPGSGSLKGKRSAVKSLKQRLRNRYNVSVAEVDDLDKWQAATLAIVTVSSDGAFIQSVLDKIIDYAENDPEAQVIDCRREILNA